MSLSKEVMASARKNLEAERALRILGGYVVCKACSGERMARFKREVTVNGRTYHFSRECNACNSNEYPGYFSPQEMAEDDWYRER